MLFSKVKCVNGYITLEAVLIIGVVLMSTLYFTIQLALGLYGAGLEVGMNCYDLTAFYHINDGASVHGYFSKDVNESVGLLGSIRYYAVERQMIGRTFSNDMVDGQTHWLGIANQCTIKAYKSFMEKEK